MCAVKFTQKQHVEIRKFVIQKDGKRSVIQCVLTTVQLRYSFCKFYD